MAQNAATLGSERRYSIGEEIANAVSHGVGALLSVAALVVMIVFACIHGGGTHLAAALLMGISLVLEFLFSTLYHALTHPGAKRVFRIFDHSAIYLLIAGSYAPFALITLAGRGGMGLAVLVWSVAAAGIVLECLLRERQPHWVSVAIYLALGWLVLFHIGDIVELLDPAAFGLLLAGGLCYTIGCAFYLAKKVPYLHFVWHLFVLAGATCITLSALIFII
ncbi:MULTISPECIES: PAQR family membrane homeostasis protein TrhA [Atopobiaceae]|uniref:Hemolysin III n=1 Tax=Parafannyhessea umbonata TaxID=604330 RepID=A0A1H6I470_9ACTN|nr:MULTISPECIES: hemolysin III family protein [Atopobiaceae]SEH41534.1 hemolysin III [Parafannyhessea umbonata]SJZ55142.1 hemolysin III [Olsenella sp. KH1P3]